MKVLIAVGDLGGNHVGRAYCLWLLAKHLGWQTRVLGQGALWSVIDDLEFIRDCVTTDQFADWVAWCDVVIPYAVFPETYGLVRLAGRPIVVDVDEPHWEQRYGYSKRVNAKVALHRALKGRNPALPFLIRSEVARRKVPVIVSNPALLGLYPGSTIIPHVRPASLFATLPPGPAHVAFVGTPRPHKGIDLLRSAARAAGVRLTITADPPENPFLNEEWVGRVPAARGRHILASCHAAAVLSDFSEFSSLQLPVKAIDAMMTGRVVIASRTAPLQWAVGAAGLFTSLDVGAVTATLERLHDVDARETLAQSSFARASQHFTPEAVAPTFASVLQASIA